MLIFHLRACQSGSDSGQNPSSQVFHPKSELSSPDHLGFFRLIALALVTIFILAGCSTIKVKTVTTKQSLTSQRSSILTSSELSSQTNAVLISAGTNSNQCLKSLGECVQMLSDSMVQSPSDLHGALSEIYLAFALKYESSRECRKPGSGGGTPGGGRGAPGGGRGSTAQIAVVVVVSVLSFSIASDLTASAFLTVHLLRQHDGGPHRRVLILVDLVSYIRSNF